MLALQVLGGFRVLREGREVSELAAQKSRAALLVYLGMEASTTRDAAVGILWPEHDPLKARHALSQTLHRLRGALGAAWLEVEGERLSAADSFQVDARLFERLVDAGSYEDALALYRGPFLDGWFLAGAPAFERWADQQRARLERLHRLACREAVRVRRVAGDLQAALRLANEWAEADPLEDEAQHRLIELLSECGRRVDALRQFALHSRLLEREGLTPLEETVQLVARIRSADDVGPLADTNRDAERSPPDGEAGAAGGSAPPATAAAAPPHGDGAPAQSPASAPAPPAVRRGTRRLAWLAAALAAAAAAVLLVLQLGPGAGERSPDLAPGARVVLADFGNDTRDSLVAGVVTEALRIDLERHLHSGLIDPAEVANVLARMRRSPMSALPAEAAREVALRAGAAAVIDGRVGAVGPGFVLSAWVVGAEDGHVLDAALATARDSAELISAIEDISTQLRRIVRPAVEGLPPPQPLAQVSTSSLEALRRYSLALRAWRQVGDGIRAVRLLEEATALDSTFAMAHRARASVLMSIGRDRSEWIEALAEAYRYRDHLSEPERNLTVASYHQGATGDLEQAIHAYEDLLALDPNQTTALNNLGVLHRDLRHFELAEGLLRRCTEVDTLNLTCATNLVGTVHALGRPAEALSIAEDYVRRFPENPFAHSQLGWIAAAAQDYARADSLFQDMRRLELPNPGGLEVWLAELDMVRGRVEEARRHLENAYRIARGEQQRTAALALLEISWMEVHVRRDTARAIAAAEAALRDPVLAEVAPDQVPHLLLADLFLALGLPDRAEDRVESFLIETLPEWRSPEDGALYVVRGVMAMQRGRLQEARDAFLEAQAHTGSELAVAQYMGPLEEMAGRPDSAIAAYERYLGSGTLDRMMFDAMYLPGVLERLGALHEAAGHASRAAAYYERLADLWAEADPELRPRAEAARERARSRGDARGTS